MQAVAWTLMALGRASIKCSSPNESGTVETSVGMFQRQTRHKPAESRYPFEGLQRCPMILKTEPIVDHFAKEAFRRLNEAVEARVQNIQCFETAEPQALSKLDTRVERERRRCQRWYRIYCAAHNMPPVQ
jgi:hypothetical protein